MKEKISTLILDDDYHDYLYLEDILEDEFDNLDLEYVSSKKQLENKIAQKKYDCFICDYDLGYIKATLLIEQIKKNNSQAPIIFISGNTNPAIKKEILSQGATDVFHKDNLKPDELYKLMLKA